MMARFISGAWVAPLPLLTSFVALWAAGTNLLDFARNADTIYLARALERSVVPEASHVNRFDVGRLLQKKDCSDSGSRSRLTVAFAVLGEADSSRDPARVTDALHRAQEAAQARLQCSPVDGNAWLEWSKLEQRRAGPSRNVVEGLKNSAVFAPSEFWVLGPRLDVEAMLAASDASLALQFTTDLRQFIQFEDAAVVALAYAGHGSEVRRLMRGLIEALPQARRSAIAAAMDRLGLALQNL